MEYENGIFKREGFESVHENELLDLIRTTDFEERDDSQYIILSYYRTRGKCSLDDIDLISWKRFLVSAIDFVKNISHEYHDSIIACNERCKKHPTVKSGFKKFDAYLAVIFLFWRDSFLFQKHLSDNVFSYSYVAIHTFFDVMFVSGPYSKRSQRIRMLGLDVSCRQFLFRLREQINYNATILYSSWEEIGMIRNMAYFLFSLGVDTFIKLDTHHETCDIGAHSLAEWILDPKEVEKYLKNDYGGYSLCITCRSEEILKYLRREFNTTQSLFNILSNKLRNYE